MGAVRLHHTGMLEFVTERAARRGMIGVAMNNTEPLMVPVGGRRRAVGNNPLSVSVPSSAGPVTLDMALSVVALGKVREALFEGKEIGEGWAVDGEGRPTRDPKEAMLGSLLPVGGHKGFGLAFVVDVLAGALIGAAVGPDVKTWSTPGGWNSGFLAISIDPAAFVGREELSAAVSRYVRRIKEIQGVKVYVPGEDRAERAQESRRFGLRISSRLAENLVELARGTPTGEELSKYVAALRNP